MELPVVGGLPADGRGSPVLGTVPPVLKEGEYEYEYGYGAGTLGRELDSCEDEFDDGGTDAVPLDAVTGELTVLLVCPDDDPVPGR